MSTVVEIWEYGDAYEFATAEEAQKWVADIYKKWHGEHAVVLFRKTPDGLQLKIDEQLFVIGQD